MSYSKLTKGISAASSSIDPIEFIRELKKLHKEARKLDPALRTEPSPYLQDRPDYNPNRVEGTDGEDSWKYVPTSRDEEISIVQNEELNKKKLNILF